MTKQQQRRSKPCFSEIKCSPEDGEVQVLLRKDEASMDASKFLGKVKVLVLSLVWPALQPHELLWLHSRPGGSVSEQHGLSWALCPETHWTPLSMGFCKQVLEWVVAPSFSSGSSWLGVEPRLPHCRRILYHLTQKYKLLSIMILIKAPIRLYKEVITKKANYQRNNSLSIISNIFWKWIVIYLEFLQ